MFQEKKEKVKLKTVEIVQFYIPIAIIEETLGSYVKIYQRQILDRSRVYMFLKELQFIYMKKKFTREKKIHLMKVLPVLIMMIWLLWFRERVSQFRKKNSQLLNSNSLQNNHMTN